MNAVLGFHLFATLVFVLGSAAVGVRLVLLSRRTREKPELLLGLAIFGTAVVGYGLLIASAVVRGTAEPDSVPAASVVLTGLGKTLHNLGVTCFFLFVLSVFRPTERWARALAGAALLALWGGMLWGAAHGAFRDEIVGSAAWWSEYAVVWAYPVWMGIESLRYWKLLRRRAALGLSDAMVTNRFALWGTGSVFSALAIWTASAPFFFILADAREAAAAAAPVIQVLTAIAGIASVTCSYLAFLPPAWYQARVAARSTT